MDTRPMVAGSVIIFAIFIGMAIGSATVAITPPPHQDSVAVIETSPSSNVPLEKAEEKTPPAPTATTTKNTVTPAPPKTTASPPATKTVTPPPPQPTQAEFEDASSKLRASIINILCLSQNHDIKSISGSGVMIDPRGIILTNAHIGQYFLLSTKASLGVSCTIRTGSPARAAYFGRLIYLPKIWVDENAKILTEEHPTGDGAHDYALLAVTGSATRDPLPVVYPFTALATDDPTVDEPVILGTYAAQFISSGEIQSSLYPTIVYSSIKAIFTFVSTTIDVISLGGSAAAQQGSSGGAIATAHNTVAGIVTTSTSESQTAARNLSGITAGYIYRDYAAQTNSSLTQLFSKDPLEAANDFAGAIPALRDILLTNVSQ